MTLYLEENIIKTRVHVELSQLTISLRVPAEALHFVFPIWAEQNKPYVKFTEYVLIYSQWIKTPLHHSVTFTVL